MVAARRARKASDPSPRDISRLCISIRTGWTEQDFRLRSGLDPRPIQPPLIRLDELDPEASEVLRVATDDVEG